MYQILLFLLQFFLVGASIIGLVVCVLLPGPPIPSPGMVFTNETFIEKK